MQSFHELYRTLYHPSFGDLTQVPVSLMYVLSAAAQTQEEEGNAARQKLQALLARKQEAVNKLELLQQELAMMQNMNPAELAALEKEVGKLVAEAAAAESKKAAMEMQVSLPFLLSCNCF